MADKPIRPAAKKPQPTASNQDKRKLELIQLETRYKSTYRLVSDDDQKTLIRLAVKPSDPDFPYDIDALQLQITVPKEYPKQACTIQVLNSDIPKGFAVNVERGYAEKVTPSNSAVHQTLVRQMNWLDRNLETLLQQAPAPTVRFVSHKRHSTPNVEEQMSKVPVTAAVASAQQQHQGHQQSVKPSAEATPDRSSSRASTSVISSSAIPIMEQANATATEASNTTTDASNQTYKNNKDTIKKHNFSAEQLAEAAEKRARELRQLQHRFCNSYRLIRTKSADTIVALTMTINDPEFTHELLLGGKELAIKYIIPELYPLIPSKIELDNKNIDKTRESWIVSGFNEHLEIETNNLTLFENLNWLNRHLEQLISTPPVRKSEEQEEVDKLAAAQQQNRRSSSLALQQSEQSQPINQQQPSATANKSSRKVMSLFDEDDLYSKKNNVIIVNDPSFVDMEQSTSDEQEETTADDESSSEDEELEKDKEPQQDSSTKTVVSLAQATVRRGTEIRLEDPRMENISLFRCTLLHIMVKCARCKDTVEVENIKPEVDPTPLASAEPSSSTNATATSKTERWTTCPTCSSVLGIKFLGEFIHQGAKTLGLLQLAGCTAYDLLPSAFIGTCGSCMADMPSTLKLSPHDPPKTIHCFSCHAKMTCNLGEYKFVKIGSEGGERLRANEEQILKLKRKKKDKEASLTVGEPLPNQGTCAHYRKSKRWFRFSCCNKLYPCDICHDSQTDHVAEIAKRFVCGLCSREQSFHTGKPCACGQEFEKQPMKGAFWEGGKGVRDKASMSRRDPHKHKGLAKTTSKKQERVGLAGKQRHQKDTKDQQ
ncbi:hypothetical protein BDF20DRAFT_893724 [Mycotypha africana]|uniref:uncharacterized protein n=1 Tax=Mycotypha africana TaxID=64632 RepID=UPI0023007187|nr:uncharacterized protein BDF20DRAFT_893724 [Mycotypha africana]KAI8969206.1 hypothetical protein BDF20DRAFT_893724 [Mycotypha africana]